MNTFKLVRIAFLIICFIMIFQVFTSGESVAATYYIAPYGSNSNNGATNCSNAWRTFSYAQSQMSAGDTLYLCDGTYTTANSGMLHATKSGTPNKYITFEAVNDGSAVIDCNNTCSDSAIDAKNYDWIKFIGIHARESDGGSAVVHVPDKSSNIVMQRITARDAENGNNSHVFVVSGSNVLLEDCAGWGIGRNMLLIYKPATNVTVRRFFAQLKEHDGTGGGMACTQIYGASNTLMENFLCTVHDNLSSEYAQTNGISIWDNNQNSTNNNTVYGSVVYDLNKVERTGRSKDFGLAAKSHQIYGNSFINSVSIGHTYGGNEHSLVYGLGDRSSKVTNCTFIGADEDGIEVETTNSPATADNLTVKNTIVMNSSVCGYDKVDALDKFTHAYNTFHNNRTNFCDDSQSSTENNKNPNFDTTTYGYGAYLMRPAALRGLGEGGADIGAEVLYRYENGVLTNKPLWPWPMEDRIYKELGTSVTYASKGGLWKTLEGVYDSSQAQSPSSPTGLRVLAE